LQSEVKGLLIRKLTWPYDLVRQEFVKSVDLTILFEAPKKIINNCFLIIETRKQLLPEFCAGYFEV